MVREAARKLFVQNAGGPRVRDRFFTRGVGVRGVFTDKVVGFNLLS